MSSSTRYSVHPDHFQTMSTQTLREHFLIERLFVAGTIQHVYSHFDRFIVAGATPAAGQSLKLETLTDLKSEYFLERRELGIINVGAPGSVQADDKTYALGFKEALYLGRGVKEVSFRSDAGGQALFYLNSAPAHVAYPSRKISLTEAETVELGSAEASNQRTIRKLLVNSVLPTCQLQMGLTELKSGSVWNTMPPHTHSRRMEVYFYFDLQETQAVSHFMGPPNETRHLWIHNRQAVISPPWSVHCGAGTSSYSFIWGMAGENLDYSDMDGITAPELR